MPHTYTEHTTPHRIKSKTIDEQKQEQSVCVLLSKKFVGRVHPWTDPIRYYIEGVTWWLHTFSASFVATLSFFVATSHRSWFYVAPMGKWVYLCLVSAVYMCCVHVCVCARDCDGSVEVGFSGPNQRKKHKKRSKSSTSKRHCQTSQMCDLRHPPIRKLIFLQNE